MNRKIPSKKFLPKGKKLTDREIKVLVLICRELSPIEISRRLKISEKTFFNHRANIVAKIKAKSNIGLFRYAVRNGYTKL